MSGTELIMGMEEIVQEMSELKEALAQKFYDHYNQMNYNKLNIARTVGPNLGRMVEHLIKENKRLQEENESLQEEKDDYDAMMIDAEAVDQEKDNTISSYEEDIKKLKEENKKLQEEKENVRGMLSNEIARREKSEMSDKSARMTLSETIDELELAKEIAYQCGVTLFSDSEEEEEEEVVFLYPNGEGSIQDPEHPEDNYSFGDNSKSKIADKDTMKRILKNGSIKDCVAAYAYCMFVKGGKLYYRGRSSSGPAHVRTIKGEKTTMEFPY